MNLKLEREVKRLSELVEKLKKRVEKLEAKSASKRGRPKKSELNNTEVHLVSVS